MSIRSIPALSCPQENQEAVCIRGRCPPSHSSWSSCAWEATEKQGRAGCLSVPGHCRHSVLSLPLFFRALTLTGLQTELRCFDFLLLPGVKRQLQRAAGCSVLSLAMRRHGAGSRWLAPSVLSLLQPGRILLPAELAQDGGCLEGPAWPLHSITGLEEPVTCAEPHGARVLSPPLFCSPTGARWLRCPQLTAGVCVGLEVPQHIPHHPPVHAYRSSLKLVSSG